jgi:hypothetical protein
MTEMDAAARGLGLTLHLVEARAPSEFEGAFARMAAAHVGAFIVQQDELFPKNRRRFWTRPPGAACPECTCSVGILSRAD